MMEFSFDKIKFLFPYIGSIIIFCGFTKLNIYYDHFNINISDYLEITEVLTLVIADIIKGIMVIFAIKLFDFLTETDKEAEAKQVRYNNFFLIKSFRKRVWNYISTRQTFTILILFIFIFSIISYCFKKETFSTFVIMFLYAFTMYVSIFLLLEYKRKYKEVTDKEFDGTYSNLVTLFIVFFLFTIQTTYNDIEKTKTRNPVMICFKYLEEDVQSNQNLLYVGQTKNYIFIYDKITKETKVYSRSDVKMLAIEKR